MTGQNALGSGSTFGFVHSCEAKGTEPSRVSQHSQQRPSLIHRRNHRLEGFQHHIEGRPIKALPHTYDKTSLSQDSQLDILGTSFLMPSRLTLKEK